MRSDPSFPTRCLLAIALLGTVNLAHAELSAADAAKLGKALTPLGAEKAGNAAGTIPPWEGGLTKAPGPHAPGGHYADPYADDKPLFVISGANAEQYRAQLSPGQYALLKKYPDYRMTVYPSRRSAAFPAGHYEETAKAAVGAKLSHDGNAVTGTIGGVPFPIPKTGQEAIWNHLLRYRGETYSSTWTQVSPTRGGDYTPVRMTFEYDFHYGALSKAPSAREPGKIMNFFQSFLTPPRLAGTVVLVHDTIDQVAHPRSSWTYNQGQRRVRLAPEVGYDNPGASSDGLRTFDDFFLFNGAIDRYHWKLVGKRELYVPYNSYRLLSPKLKHSELIRPGHLNPEPLRYELHRVWEVEATVKPGMSHLYRKRVFFIDEDSWAALVTDKYDARGELWRVGESHGVQMYDIPMYFPMVEVHHDLAAGRYVALGLRNEEPEIYRLVKRTAADYTPANLRNLGIR